MKTTLVCLMAIFGSTAANADTCFGGSSLGKGFCAVSVTDKGSTVKLSGLYIDIGDSLHLGIRKNKRKILCSAMGFASTVEDSAVIQSKDVLVVDSGGMILRGEHKVVTEIECVKL